MRVAKQDLEAWIYDVPNVMVLDPLAAAAWLNDRPDTVYGKLAGRGRRCASGLRRCSYSLARPNGI